MNKRRKPIKFGRILVLIILIAGGVYVNQVIVPSTPPLFIPTPTATRAPESYITEAQRLENEGKFNQAINLYNEAVQSDPRNPATYVSLARLLIYTGKYEDAVKNAENALLLNGNNSSAHAIRGWALGLQGDYLGAEAAFTKALELDQNNADAYAYRAEVLANQTQAGTGSIGSLDKAVEASRNAQTIAPNSLSTHRARGIVLELTGNYADAAREFEQAVAINGNIADLHLALGRNYRYLEQYDKAVEEFNRANALNPGDPLPNYYISRTYAAIGEYAKAIQFAEQSLKVDPTDPYMYGNLGTMYYKNKQFEDAIKPLKMAVSGGTADSGEEVKGLPLDYGRVAEFYFTYGLALANLGMCGDALPISQTLLEGVKNDEVSVFNAQEIVNICSGNPTSPDKLNPVNTTPGVPSEADMEKTPDKGKGTPVPKISKSTPVPTAENAK
ncbi:tetratricopeptide repeat protein [Leptolinea tardivitalis]|nr:tetratricopeptide repeat protein [Leptolinea tardivitalis]